jgi:hypothetical protein
MGTISGKLKLIDCGGGDSKAIVGWRKSAGYAVGWQLPHLGE